MNSMFVGFFSHTVLIVTLFYYLFSMNIFVPYLYLYCRGTNFEDLPHLFCAYLHLNILNDT